MSLSHCAFGKVRIDGNGRPMEWHAHIRIGVCGFCFTRICFRVKQITNSVEQNARGICDEI